MTQPAACAMRSLAVELHHRLGSFELEVAFTLAQQATVLFGPSGAGKTTILRAIAGLFTPRRACIAFDGLLLTDTGRHIHLRPAHRGVGMVPQRPALFPHMTVRENINFGLDGLPGGERHERIKTVLEMFFAASLADRLPVALSGGEKQRVVLARTFAPAPSLLLLDEPLSGLDSSLRITILQRVQAWCAQHRSQMLYVTHDIAEVFDLNAHVIVVQDGKVIREGTADEALAAEREHLLSRLNRSMPAVSAAGRGHGTEEV